MAKCDACGELIQVETDSIKCTGNCKRIFHFFCGGLTDRTFRMTEERKNRWRCARCVSQQQNTLPVPSVKHQETPIMGSPECNSERENADVVTKTATTSTPQERDKANPAENINELLEKLQTENSDLRSFIATQFQEYSKNLEYHNGLVNDLSKSFALLQNEIFSLKKNNSTIQSENERLRIEVAELRAEMTELQQYSRRTNIEISGIPEVENEIVIDTVKSVLVNLEVPQLDNILVAHRVPSNRKDRHKPIIVQCTSKMERDRIIAAAKKKRLHASNIDSRFNQTPVYLNEHLAPGLKKLLYQIFSDCFHPFLSMDMSKSVNGPRIVIDGETASGSVPSKRRKTKNQFLEKTLAMVKPNAMNKTKEIEEIINKEGFGILKKRRLQLTREQASDFYSEHEGKDFFQGLVDFMISGPVWVMILARPNAVAHWRKVMGPTDPKTARLGSPESIRALYGGEENPYNAVHGSDSLASADREIKFFFPDIVFNPELDGELSREYLAKTVNPVLLKGLVQLCRQRPENPVIWLADWLLANNPNKIAPHLK